MEAGELRMLLLAVQRDLHRLLGEALRPLSVTPAQAEVLTVLAGQAPLSLQALGERLVCETGSPSRLVAGLVRAGLVAREPSADDGRQIALRLTSAGAERAAQVAAAELEFEAEVSGLLAGLPVEDLRDALWRLVRLLPSGKALRLRLAEAQDATAPA
jgi:MarR family transcriptional regulator, organic hydroperoxide resistance regulator